MEKLDLIKLLDNSTEEGGAVCIWGTGNTALLNTSTFLFLESQHNIKILGYCTNNKAQWGTVFNGKTVFSPDELVQNHALVLVCSGQENVVKEIKNQVFKMGLTAMLPAEFLYKRHSKEILEVYDNLEDEKSKNIYLNIIKSKLAGKLSNKIFEPNQYFCLPPFKHRNGKNVFVDIGSFVGDSVEKFIWENDGIFDKIFAFEPDSQNYKALETRCKRLAVEWNKENSIIIYPYGVGEKSETAFVLRDSAENGLGSKIANENAGSSECVKIIALDDIIKDRISLIKADIEGYELKMLKGAKNLIKNFKPNLAICIYHSDIDMFQIPLYVKSLVPEYKLAIRHHSYDFSETVLYAWV